jgi:hypothetical protein
MFWSRARLLSVEVLVLVSSDDAVFCFPELEGNMDYTGFKARDPVQYKPARSYNNTFN